MTKDIKVRMRNQKDWIAFKTKFKGIAIRKGFKVVLTTERPDGVTARMITDPTDPSRQIPESPAAVLARQQQWDEANALCMGIPSRLL